MSVYILAGTRTPIGSFMGSLSTISAPSLGAKAIEGAISLSGLDKNLVEEVYMGNVIQAGVGQAPTRQAALFSGLDKNVKATTINKVCGSGLESVLIGGRSILCGDAEVVIAGGMENMSMAPGLLPHYRSGFKFGSSEIKDSMQWDGLWDVYSNRPMGNCAEECAKEFKISRESQDEFSIESFKRAQKAQAEGFFQKEITPVILKSRKGDVLVEEDEGPQKVKFDKIPHLKPAFDKSGTITAANASTINDGAAAIILASEKYKEKAKFKIHSWASHAQDPTWFTTAPIEAMKKNLQKANLSVNDIDLFEINEAFALVTMAAMKSLGLSESKVNIFGGAVSLGHPIGCSGARILVTLMNAMEIKAAKMGMASICIGGGEALSVIIERV